MDMWSAVYNMVLSTVSGGIKMLSHIGRKTRRPKFFRFADGQRGLIHKIERENASVTADKRTYWFHAASLGEYSIIRPIINELNRRGGCRIVVTFFSPTGVEAVQKSHPGIEHVYFLPLDTKRNVVRFLNAVKPDVAAFAVSEYWYNYLRELSKRGIPTFLISAKINETSIFFRPYGFLHRRCLECYTNIFVLDKVSAERLAHLGKKEVTVSGNPLFDNAVDRCSEPWSDAFIEQFVDGSDKVVVAGSVHDENDTKLVCELANSNPDTKFIIVPHEISDEFIQEIEKGLEGTGTRYSQGRQCNLADCQWLIIDHIGHLAYIYRYGTAAYVGGGFTSLLHSLIEAAVYGIPVSFGPRTERKITPAQLVELGIGNIVKTPEEIKAWWSGLKDNPDKLREIRSTAKDYVAANTNATNSIVTRISE